MNFSKNLPENHDIVRVDYNNPEHCTDLITLLNNYAKSTEGGGTPLSQRTRHHLTESLAQHPLAFSLLYYVDTPAGRQAIGLANCFEGFSTFACQPLINIHDFAIDHRYQDQGLSQYLLGAIEQVAREKQCSKITLEVLEENIAAKKAYRKYGFSHYELHATMGKALFWEKTL